LFYSLIELGEAVRRPAEGVPAVRDACRALESWDRHSFRCTAILRSAVVVWAADRTPGGRTWVLSVQL